MQSVYIHISHSCSSLLLSLRLVAALLHPLHLRDEAPPVYGERDGALQGRGLSIVTTTSSVWTSSKGGIHLPADFMDHLSPWIIIWWRLIAKCVVSVFLFNTVSTDWNDIQVSPLPMMILASGQFLSGTWFALPIVRQPHRPTSPFGSGGTPPATLSFGGFSPVCGTGWRSQRQALLLLLPGVAGSLVHFRWPGLKQFCF